MKNKKSFSIHQRKATNLFLAFAIGLFLSILPQHSDAIVRYVDANAVGLNNGSSWANAFNDLQNGIAAAVSGDQIWVRAATYFPDGGTGNRAVYFQLKPGVEIYGGFAGTETSLTQRDYIINPTRLSGDIGIVGINSDNSFHVVNGSNAAGARLDGFSIIRGNANGSAQTASGGGVYIFNSSPTFANCVITSNNSTGDGAGAFMSASTSLFYSCTFSNNTTSAGNGGGARCIGQGATFERCFFTANSAPNTSSGTGRGAGAAVSNSNVTFTSCVIRNNFGNQGPGIHGQHITSTTNPVNFTITLHNCTISGNDGTAAGGGLSSSAVRIFSSLPANTVSVNANSTILYNNIANSGSRNTDQISSGTVNTTLTVNYSDVQSYVSGVYAGDAGNIGADPVFIADASGPYHIHNASPCRDIGDPAITQVSGLFDIDGERRVDMFNNQVDMGADEINVKPAHYQKTEYENTGSSALSDNMTTIMDIFPNPASGDFQIQYSLLKAGRVEIDIFTLDGKKVTTLINREQESGNYQFSANENLATFSSGVYFVSFRTYDTHFVKKLVIFQ